MASTGQNVWFDLMTTDAKAAQSFYTETIGWKAAAWPDGDPANPYSMWMAGEHSVGGVMKLPDEATKMGAPPHWLAYTTVEDVDATAARTTELGGKVLRQPWHVPKVGRIAVLQDPQGATFGVFRPEGDMPAADASAVGEFAWTELSTTDYESAWSFYSALFGWQHTDSMDMGEAGTYFMFKDPEEITTGGMFNGAKQMSIPPHWLHFVSVDDIDSAVQRVKKMGGKVLNGPMEVPGGGKVAQCQDPQGASFAMHAAAAAE